MTGSARLCPRRDGGSVLMLMPAGVLIVLVLAAIAVDLSLVFLRQRQASATAADIANDLATAALDIDELRASGRYRLDPGHARELGRAMASESDLGEDLLAIEVDVLDDATVRVTIEAAVDYIWARSIPGAAEGTEVRATATATASDGS